MKIKMLVAALFLSMGATSVFAQTENCNSNSSISHEAVRAGNFKDAYAPCMAVLKDCPTLKRYTYTDAIKILNAFLGEIKDRNSADYKKYFDELMMVYDQEIQYLPELNKKLKATQQLSAAKELGKKAVAYLQYAPQADVNVAYGWLKEAAAGTADDPDAAILHYFLEMSMRKVQADKGHTNAFYQDFADADKAADEALVLVNKEITDETAKAEQQNAQLVAKLQNKRKNLQDIKENLVAMLVKSGVAECATLQEIFGPQVEEKKAEADFLKSVLAILKMMRCNESEVYFKASEYMYALNPTADAAVGVAYMYYKQGDYDSSVKFFQEALDKETDPDKRAEMAYITAAALMNAKKLGQARKYCMEAIKTRADYGDAYILLAQMYASSPNWSDEGALNKCTYFVAIDKLQRAKSVDPKVADRANELIRTYAKYTPQPQDLFMLGYKAGDRITVGGWIGETTTIR